MLLNPFTCYGRWESFGKVGVFLFFFPYLFWKLFLSFPFFCVASTWGLWPLLKLWQERRGKKKLKIMINFLRLVCIIISVGCFDNSTMMFNIMVKFKEERCVLALCALERRKSFKTTSKWYAKFYISSFVALNKLIKKLFGWG